MKNRLLFLIKYFAFWLVYFELVRLFFIAYNKTFAEGIPSSEIVRVFLYGFKLDLSLTGYILLLTSFVAAFSVANSRILYYFSKAVTLLLLVLFSVVAVVDMELYAHWGFRIDATIFLYLKTPKESLASTPVPKLIGLIIFAVLITVLFYYFFCKYVLQELKNKDKTKWYFSPLFLLFSAMMIIPIRGGLGLAPINQGSVFFSKYQFANHAAINCFWNFGKTMSLLNKRQEVRFMPEDEASALFDELLEKKKDTVEHLITKEHPNIIIIILESFTANVVGSLGGMEGVTPNLNRLSGEGVLFSGLFASGDRSDKGLVAILSGYPAQPKTSVIKDPVKMEKLPFLSKNLSASGYSSGFYYGGDIDFANMRSYFITGGYDTLVTLEDFDKKDLNSKWGAHDHVVFNRFLEDLNKTKEPVFRVMFTLSSHEPFDVPHKSRFYGSSEEQMFLNSVYYTDSCLGVFVEKAKNASWWKNTWLILVADHGSRLPGNILYNMPEKFRIPMLWLGGAVRKDTIIDAVFSQNDIPLMVSDQLNLPPAGYKFSKDVLTGQKHFAFFSYNNGFGFYHDSTGFVWNDDSKQIVYNDSVSPQTIKEGKAFLQVLIRDYNQK